MSKPKETFTNNLQAVASLRSDTCPMCGAGKTPMRTFCGGCFGRLPSALARALYRKVFEGYLEALQAALEHLSKAAGAETCRRCPAPIIFAVQNPTKSNPHPKPNPLNAEPQPDGNLRLDRQTMRYDVLTGEALAGAKARKEELYLSHFATCPARQMFRRSA
jgi:hypothetical protein